MNIKNHSAKFRFGFLQSLICFSFLLLQIQAQVQAQEIIDPGGIVPGRVDPTRVDQRLRPRAEVPELGAPVEIPLSVDRLVSGDAELQYFRIRGVTFEGLVTLADGAWEAISSEYLGRNISFSDIDELARRLTAAYRAEGYILARAIIPAQRIDDGQLIVQVIEGFIDSVEIEGDADGASSLLLAHAERIKSVRPLTASVLERELLIASDTAGFTVRAVLTPSTITQDASSLTLVVDKKPFDLYMAADNFSSRYLGGDELVLSAHTYDLFGAAESLGFTGVATPNKDSEVTYGALSFQKPLLANGLSLFLSHSYSQTRPTIETTSLQTEAESKATRFELSYPFVRSRNVNLIGTFALYAADIRAESELINPIFEDNVRNASASLFVNALDSWSGYNTAQFSLVQGIRGLGASKSSDSDLSRTNVEIDYLRFNFEVTRRQSLGGSFSLLVGAAGQTSFGDNLLASEEWALGGSFYGRAFDPAEITGEKGLAGMVELQWDAPFRNRNIQLFSFYESGMVKQELTLAGQQKSEEIRSAGAGLRALMMNKINLDVFVAKPLERDVTAEGDRNARIFFSVSAYF